MNVRTTLELNDLLSEELTWRKHELTTTKFLIVGARSHERRLFVRAGVCILYAHWEGFIKNAATAYLSFVSKQGLKYCDLAPSLLALSMRSRLRAAEETNRVTIHTELVSFLISDLQEKAELSSDSVVDARDNLNWQVLQEILCLLGLEPTRYITKKAIIDDKLLYYRHRIAHGVRIDLDMEDYLTIHHEVLGLIELLRNDIDNAAITGRYRRSVA